MLPPHYSKSFSPPRNLPSPAACHNSKFIANESTEEIWNNLRNKVRRVRASTNISPPILSDIYFDKYTKKLIFIASKPKIHNSRRRDLLSLYSVDLTSPNTEGMSNISSTLNQEKSDNYVVLNDSLSKLTVEKANPASPWGIVSSKSPIAEFEAPDGFPSLSASYPPNKVILSNLPEKKEPPTKDLDLTPSDWVQLIPDNWYNQPFFHRRRSRDDEKHCESKRSHPAFGLSEFQYNSTTGRCMFSFHNSLYNGSISKDGKLISSEVSSGINSDRFDCKMGTASGNLFSFIRNDNIFISSAQGVERQITFDGICKDISCGQPDYILREEFNLTTGYFWSPLAIDGKDAIVYLRTDESPVEQFVIANEDGRNVDVHKFAHCGGKNSKYTIKIVELDTKADDVMTMRIVDKHLPPQLSLKKLFPWMEYITRFGWLPDGKSVWLQILDRLQARVAYVEIPKEKFIDDENDEIPTSDGIRIIYEEQASHWINVYSTIVFLEPTRDSENMIRFLLLSDQSGYCHLQLVECRYDGKLGKSWFSSRQITSGDFPVVDKGIVVDEVNELVYFLARTNPLESHVCLGSFHRNAHPAQIIQLTNLGYSHDELKVSFIETGTDIYLATLFSNCSNSVASGVCQLKYEYVETLESHINEEAFLKAWNASNSNLFTTALNNLIQQRIGKPIDISQVYNINSSNHSATFPCPSFPERQIRISVLPNKIILHPLAFSIMADGTLESISNCPPLYKDLYLPFPDYFEYDNEEGVRIFGLAYRPKNKLEGISYPTLLEIYGGPGIQMVSNEFRYYKDSRSYLFPLFGYVVVMIDSRGSSNRGVQFEGIIKKKFGSVELRDQVKGLHFLASTPVDKNTYYNDHDIQFMDINSMNETLGKTAYQSSTILPPKSLMGIVDLNRTAISGWSYGGFLTLLAMAHYPDIFRFGIAGAPVVQWEDYDTAYTERYLGLPSDNPNVYRECNAINHVDFLPDGPNRLLIVHGMMDENVHFSHTRILLNSLITQNKPHQLQIYPMEKHGLQSPIANEHFETLMVYWMEMFL